MNMYERCGYAVELVGSHRPVGGRWETRSVFHGPSTGLRAAQRWESAKPTVHKSTASVVSGAAMQPVLSWGHQARE
jgi:hypothetical protein